MKTRLGMVDWFQLNP